eukprot:222374-Pleurochrysis_carterae.AAC.4
MRPTSLRALAAVASGMRMRRWDFVVAYLQGYATLGADGRPRVCRVKKPVYGMAQAGRRWQPLLFPWLLDLSSGSRSAVPTYASSR